MGGLTMGLFDRQPAIAALDLSEAKAEIARSARSFERPSTSLSNPDDWLLEAFGSGPTGSGVSVSAQSAMRFAAVYACVRLLAETLASLPLIVYRRTSGGGKERADDHDVYPVLHDEWNSAMTSFSARESLQAHVDTGGNAYSVIERDGGGYLVGLWPVPAGCMEPVVNRSKVWYRITSAADEIIGVKPGLYPASDVLHIPGLGFDGLVGHSPIAMAREAIGLGIAAEKFGAAFFGKGARPNGIITTEQPLSDDDRRKLRRGWEEIHGGVYNSHKTAVMSHGMKYVPISISPEDAQFLETRQFQIAEIARIFRVPPHFIGAKTGDSLTYSTVEQEGINFVTHTMRPIARRWEQEINRKLFTPREKSRYFAEFLFDDLLRGDIGSRYSAYKTGIEARFLTPNEVRARENLNPLEGGDDVSKPQPAPAPAAPNGGDDDGA